MKKDISFPLSYLADFSGAQLKGNPDCQITSIASLKKAKPADITFLVDNKYQSLLSETKAACVILSDKHSNNLHTNALVHPNPLFCYAKIATLFEAKQEKPLISIHPSTVIGENCKIHPTAIIGPQVTIGSEVEIGENTVIKSNTSVESKVKIGKDCLIYPNVIFYHNVSIGDRCIIHSGAVIGSDGFGNAKSEDGTWVKIPQLGEVKIGNDVEVGANTTIDRGAIDDTIIGNGVKLDNQIQIAHNVHIGDNTAIAACTGLAGSARIGKNCMIGGGTNILGHINVTDHTVVAGASNLGHSVEEPGFYVSAFDSMHHIKWKKIIVRFQQLPEIAKRLKQLEKKVCE